MVDSIPLSMLNALAFCERRFVYEFVRGEMLVNHHVYEGDLLHGTRAHRAGSEQDGQVLRHVPLHSHKWRIHGIVDFIEERNGGLIPVEYKKGKRGPWDSDAVQLCGAALCIEEWKGERVHEGEIFYFGSRRRRVVLFDDALRNQTASVIERAFELAAQRELPVPTQPWSKCRHCSLEPLCLPRETKKLRELESKVTVSA